jgi:hypothetical protein
MSPTAPTELRHLFATLRAQSSKIALKDRAPEQSDLLAAEYQDALDSLLKFIEIKLPA